MTAGSACAEGGVSIERSEASFSYWLGVGAQFAAGIGGILFAAFYGVFPRG